MRVRSIAVLAFLLMLVPMSALAQENDVTDPCYTDPTAPECTEVEGETREDFGVGGDEPPQQLDAQVLGESVDSAGLADTGTNATMLGLLAVSALGLGSLMLVVSHRRSRSTSTE